MQVTIIGAGNMGRGIGTRLVAGGNDVKVRGAAGDPLDGDVVVLAIWYEPARSVVEQYGDQLDGTVVVDITNPVDTDSFDGLVTPADSSAAEELAQLAPDGARFVKAFNTTFAGTLVDGQVSGQPLDVFIAGDDADAKETVAELARGGGLNPIDTGPLRRARELERLGFLHMALQDGLGTAYGSTIKVLS